MLNKPVADSSSEINSARFFSRGILGSGCTGVLTGFCGLLALGAVSFTWLYGFAPAEVGRLVDVLPGLFGCLHQKHILGVLFPLLVSDENCQESKAE